MDHFPSLVNAGEDKMNLDLKFSPSSNLSLKMHHPNAAVKQAKLS